MRLRTIITLLVLLPAILSSCKNNRANEEIFSQFEGERNVYIVKMPPVLFLGLLGIGGDDIDSDSLGDINYVKLMVHSPEEENDSGKKQDVFFRLKTAFSESEYENVGAYSSGSTFVSAYLLEDENYVSDIMILIKEGSSLVCLGLSGKINGEAVLGFASELEYDKLRSFVDSK